MVQHVANSGIRSAGFALHSSIILYKQAMHEPRSDGTEAVARSSVVIWRRYLSLAAKALGKYRRSLQPLAYGGSPACVFHIQVLQDFLAIDEITHKLFDEIDNFKPLPRLPSIVARLLPWGAL